MNKNSFFRGIIQARARVGRGQVWLSYFNSLFILLGLAYFESLKGHPFIAFILFIVYGCVCYVLGYIDEKHGFWLAENAYFSSEMNPVNQNILYKIDSLRREIREKKNE